MRLIDADALKKHKIITQVANGVEIYSIEVVPIECIDNAPTVSLQDIYQEGHYDGHLEGYTKAINEEKPQGEWINHRNDYGHNIADCSLCGKAMQWHDEDEDSIPRYYWYCGAEMKKEEDNHPFITLMNCPSCGNCMWRYENNDKIVCAICGYIAERR